MIPVSEALKIIKRETVPLEREMVDLKDSVRRALAEDIYADMDLPPFDRSQMDGFAVRVKDIEDASEENPVTLKIIGESVAGKGFDGRIKSGEAVRIMTGAPLPKGADAVQKKELAHQAEDGASVEIFESVKPHQHFVAKAAEIKKGVKVLKQGAIINQQTIAVLASFGYAKVKVSRLPKVSVLATGSEIVEVSETPQKDQIRDSNSASIRAFAEQTGSIVKVLPRVRDDLKTLEKTIKKAAKDSNLLILSGGVSVGDYDFTKPALRQLGADIFFEKVALRPGKPAVFAKLGNCFIFGLPGNPVSVAVTFYLFVRTAIWQMQGASGYELKEGFARVSEKMKGAKERDSYIPATVNFQADGIISVAPLKWGGSSDFVSFAQADCLIFLPQGQTIVPQAIVKIIFLPR